jgi:hypothetical protein
MENPISNTNTIGGGGGGAKLYKKSVSRKFKLKLNGVFGFKSGAPKK